MRDLKSRMLLVVFLAMLLVAALVGFAGCGTKSESTSTDGDTQEEEEATPEDVVVKFFRAIEKQDAKALVGLFDPDSLDEIKYALGNEYRSLVGEYFFGDMPEDVKFKNLKFDTDIDGKEAVVDLIKGKVVYTDEYGDEATEDLMDSEDTVTFYLVKVKGEWYISIDTFPDLIAEYDIPETETETDTDTDTGTNPNPDPQPTAEYVTCPDCAGWGGWEVGADTTCYYCNGSGVQDVQDYCYVCGGSGVLYDEYGDAWECDTCGGSGMIWDWVPCEYCGGTGLITETGWVVCETCEGTGWILEY